MTYNKEERTTLLEAFVQILEEISGIVSRLTEAEAAKTEAASTGEHKKIDSFLKDEQALLLKLRGLEQQRNRKACELGWEELTFRQILETADEKEQAILSPLFSKMETQLKGLAEVKDSSDRIISVRLREFEHILGTNKAGIFSDSKGPSHFHDRYV